MAETKTFNEILDAVNTAQTVKTEAAEDASRARSRETHAMNALAQAAKDMVRLLADMPDDFIREFDEAWGQNETVRHLRPKRGVAA